MTRSPQDRQTLGEGHLVSLHVARLLDDPAQAADISPDLIPPLLAQLAGLQSVLAARLLVLHANGHGEAEQGVRGDHLLTVPQAARELQVSPDWLYRHASQLPFTVRLGHHLRFSGQGISRYIRQRSGR